MPGARARTQVRMVAPVYRHTREHAHVCLRVHTRRSATATTVCWPSWTARCTRQ